MPKRIDPKTVKIWFIEPASCLVIPAEFLHQRFAYLDLMTYSETAHDLIDLESDLVPYLGSWYEDYKVINLDIPSPSRAVS
jgi:hypothetical protein